ncbi:MAG: hypothetical protein DSZ24_07055 [Thermodesulfatator sp.]|nr:MAG: hypothetical protein DSZ24_07055 [Thermodesulfatator sp.]
MPRKILQFPVLLEQDEDGYYITSCPSFQGCHSYGRTIEEALKNIREAGRGKGYPRNPSHRL